MLLMKQLNFRPLLVVSFGTTLASGITAIVMAWRGYGSGRWRCRLWWLEFTGTLLLWVVQFLAPRLRVQPDIVAPTVHLQ